MALNDTFIKKVKPNGTAGGVKHTDGQGLYLPKEVSAMIDSISRGEVSANNGQTFRVPFDAKALDNLMTTAAVRYFERERNDPMAQGWTAVAAKFCAPKML